MALPGSVDSRGLFRDPDLIPSGILTPKPFSPYIAVPATLGLVYRAYSRKSLTPFGIVVAALTAVVHAIHPWSIFFALLVVFFLAGTAVTKVWECSM